jgi:hypothetical protein
MILKDYIKFLEAMPEETKELEVFGLRGDDGPRPVEDYDLPDALNIYCYAPDGRPISDEGPAWYISEVTPEANTDPDHLVKKVAMI